MCKKFIQKLCNIIKAPQKHFCTVGKYISDDVLVSMTASSSSYSYRNLHVIIT